MFDEKRFKPYTRNGKKITPILSKKWKLEVGEIDTQGSEDPSYHGLDFVEEVYLIDTKGQKYKSTANKVLAWILTNKGSLNKEGHLTGEFIIDKDGEFCSKDLYEKWKERTDKNNSKEIVKKDLKEGYIYQLEDKSHIIYMGSRYISTWKERNHKIETTKVSKKAIAFEVSVSENLETKNINEYYFKPITKKIIKEIKESEQEDIVKILWEGFKYMKNAYFINDKKPTETIIPYKMDRISKAKLIELKKLNISGATVFHDFKNEEEKEFFVYREKLYIHDDFKEEESNPITVDKHGTQTYTKAENGYVLAEYSNWEGIELIESASIRVENDSYLELKNESYNVIVSDI